MIIMILAENLKTLEAGGKTKEEEKGAEREREGKAYILII